MTDTVVRSEDQRISSPNGQLHVREVLGEEPTIVLMHGFPDDHRIYRKLQTHLAPRRSIAFDFSGYGRSERTSKAQVFYEDHEADLDAVLDELGIDSAVLVGHDGSGPDAVLYALDHPQRVTGVVLLNTFFGHRPSLKMPEMTRLFSDPQLATLADDVVNDPNQLLWFVQRWGTQLGLDSDVVTNSILAQFFGDDNQSDALVAIRAWTATIRDGLSYQDNLIQSGGLSSLRGKVSVVFGEDDPYLGPALAAELSALFEDARLHLAEGARHYPQDDRPEVVADLIKRA